MEKKKLEKFIERNPVNPLSPAYITYMMIDDPAMEQLLNKAISEWENNEQDKQEAEIIESLRSPEAFFKWMRKPLKGNNKFLLRKAMLNQETAITEMILQKITTNMGDEFIECVADFLIKCQTNHIDWILQNYKTIRSPYARSELCLVLGFRGDTSREDFLLEQIDAFRREYPAEKFDQGPLIALYMINGLRDMLLPD